MKKPALIDMRSEQIRAALGVIAEANNGLLNPSHVVDAARDPSSILHEEFDWDDTSAADAYRLMQAGALIRRVKFTVVKENVQNKSVQITTTRAFQSRPSTRHADGGYESVEKIMADPQKRDELIDQVLRELSAYRRRYADLVALSEVWDAIDDALDTLSPASPQAGHGVASRSV